MKHTALSKLMNEGFSVLFDHSPDVIIIIDASTQKIVAVNNRTEEVLGYGCNDMTGKQVSSFSTEPEKTRKGTTQKAEMPVGAVMDLKRDIKKKDGTIVPMHIRSSVIEESGVKFIISIARDDSAFRERELSAALLQKQNDVLEKVSGLDPLTGLMNRRAFDQASNKELSRFDSEDRTFCICMMDVDHFKKINDRYHHDIGDKTLVAVAGIIKHNIRDIDFACRWGGDEFILLLPQCTPDNAHKCCERIRNAVMDFSISDSQQDIPLSVSIGLAQSRRNEGLEEVISRADSALFCSKEKGRNKTTLVD